MIILRDGKNYMAFQRFNDKPYLACAPTRALARTWLIDLMRGTVKTRVVQ
mgnify:CR=1 FL=1